MHTQFLGTFSSQLSRQKRGKESVSSYQEATIHSLHPELKGKQQSSNPILPK